MVASILVVDDEPRILDVVRRYLERDGFAVHAARDGQEALDLFAAVRPALVVLDLMMPRVDGWHVCRELRRASNVPILMLTARADESDTLLGLDLGADDYMTKPFSPRELVARVRALLRRAGAAVIDAAPERIVAGPLVLDIARHESSWAGTALALTPAEFRLLQVLARERRRIRRLRPHGRRAHQEPASQAA
jgi:DNA-binding response OmpR family regulator